MRIISIGEILWDIYNNNEFIGGAPFNFSINFSRFDQNIFFISSVGIDPRGDKALSLIEKNGLSTKFINKIKDFQTGYVKVTECKNKSYNYKIIKPVAYNFPFLTDKQIQDIILFDAEWIYIGTLFQMSEPAHSLTLKILESLPKVKCFYDLNLRKSFYSNSIIKKLLNLSTVVKMNFKEAKICNKILYNNKIKLREFCCKITSDFSLDGVCITMDSKGCVAYFNGEYIVSPSFKTQVISSLGAGDAFAASFIYGINKNSNLFETCKSSNEFASKTLLHHGALSIN